MKNTNFTSLFKNLEKDIIKDAQTKILNDFKKIKCPEHGIAPMVKITKKDGKDAFAFNFCCDKLKGIVEGKLK